MGEGFHLTDAKDGVRFVVRENTPPLKMAWTDQRWHNGWLALDRNGNGKIDNSEELFGNFTDQPASNNRNGFAALAVFDKRENGGNENGFIDPGDKIYDRLVLWINGNQNEISEPGELHSLRDVGIDRISVHPRFSNKIDKYGNRFRYTAEIWDKAGNKHEWCYDVFLKTLPDGI